MMTEAEITRLREERQMELAQYLSTLQELQKHEGFVLMLQRLFAAESAAYRNTLDATDPLITAKMAGMCFAYENARRWVEREIAATKQELQAVSIR